VLEGGPIPLLETMMCNAVPVASRTGFAPDLIRHGENGFLFDVEAGASTIAPLIDSAFALDDTDVRATVLDYSWDRFAQRILTLGL
jgi:glycosyltransferase involved in cell wall biosynthesis